MVISKRYYELLLDKSRYLFIYGGAGAGKSEFAARKIIYRCLTEHITHKFLIIRKYKVSIKESVWALIKSVLDEEGINYTENKTTREIIFYVNGLKKTILFTGLDDAEKLKSIKGITSIWIEELTELTYEDFMQIDLRLREPTRTYKQIMATFNPVLRLGKWIKEFIETTKEYYIRTERFTIVDNPIKSVREQYIRILTNIKDETLRKIYLHGEWAKGKGYIFENNFIVVDNYPDWVYKASNRIYGLDFGYTNPLALVEIVYTEGKVYLFERIYKSGLNDEEMLKLFKKLNINPNIPIYADPSSPDKIQILNQAGYTVFKANNKVLEGISKMLNYKIYSLKNNTNINNEFEGYKWKEDKAGNTYDEPVKFADHTVDATRYAVMGIEQGGEVFVL